MHAAATATGVSVTTAYSIASQAGFLTCLIRLGRLILAAHTRGYGLVRLSSRYDAFLLC